MLNPQTRKISQLNRDPLSSPDLAGGLIEMSLLRGPVAGAYVSFAISYEQFTAELAKGSYAVLTLAQAQLLVVAHPPAVAPGTLYAITGNWNAVRTAATVYVWGVHPTAYHLLGVVFDAQGVGRLVQVNVMAGTYAVADFVWEYVGDPANRNVSLGGFDASNTLGDFPFQNTFGANAYGCTFGDGLANNTFGNTQINITTGDYFFGNVLGVECSDCRFGDFNGYNQLGAQVQVLVTGNACNSNVFAPSVRYVYLGDGVKNCTIGAGCNAVKLGSNCERVELYNCGSSDNSHPFEIPAGTTDAVYRNNVLQTTASSTPGNGTTYTDTQARAAQLNRTATAGTTTVTLGAESATDYGTIASGSFTVDAAGCVVGKCVRFAVGAGAGAPAFSNAPSGQPYKMLGVSYASGKAFSYSLLVCVDRIEVVTLAD